jgi:hypothetical protein
MHNQGRAPVEQFGLRGRRATRQKLPNHGRINTIIANYFQGKFFFFALNLQIETYPPAAAPDQLQPHLAPDTATDRHVTSRCPARTDILKTSPPATSLHLRLRLRCPPPPPECHHIGSSIRDILQDGVLRPTAGCRGAWGDGCCCGVGVRLQYDSED